MYYIRNRSEIKGKFREMYRDTKNRRIDTQSRGALYRSFCNLQLRALSKSANEITPKFSAWLLRLTAAHWTHNTPRTLVVRICARKSFGQTAHSIYTYSCHVFLAVVYYNLQRATRDRRSSNGALAKVYDAVQANSIGLRLVYTICTNVQALGFWCTHAGAEGGVYVRNPLWL